MTSYALPTRPIDSMIFWLQGTLLGTIATAVAVITVAAIGLVMLTGCMDMRRSARVILGCFIIVGASSVAAGIEAAISISESAPPSAEIAPPPYPVIPPSTSPVPAITDPYAGAAMPQH